MLLTHTVRTGRLVGQALVLGLLCLPFFALTACSAAEIHSLHKHAVNELTPWQVTAISCAYACEAKASFILVFRI